MKKTIKLLSALCILCTCGGSSFAQDLITSRGETIIPNVANSQSENNFVWLTKADFLKKIHNYEKDSTAWKYLGNKPAVVLFIPSGDWCPPCEKMKPTFKELATEYKDKVLFYIVDSDTEKELSQVFGIKNVPTTLFIPLNETPMMDSGHDENTKTVYRNAINEILLKISNPTGNNGQSEKGININGVIWATRNVGEPKAFANTPQDYGNYYTWNEACNVCPDGWRLPTQNEYLSLMGTERQLSANGALLGDKQLFFPFPGYISHIGNLNKNGTSGYYWTNKEDKDRPTLALAVGVWEKGADAGDSWYDKIIKFSVRCVNVNSKLAATSTNTNFKTSLSGTEWLGDDSFFGEQTSLSFSDNTNEVTIFNYDDFRYDKYTYTIEGKNGKLTDESGKTTTFTVNSTILKWNGKKFTNYVLLEKLKRTSPAHSLIGTIWKDDDLVLNFSESEDEKTVWLSCERWGSGSMSGTYTFDGIEGKIFLEGGDRTVLRITKSGSGLKWKCIDTADCWGFSVTSRSGKEIKHYNGTFYKNK